MFTFAPSNSMGGLPGNSAPVSFTCDVRSTINGGVINTGMGNGLIPVSCIVGGNSRVRVVASRGSGKPDHS